MRKLTVLAYAVVLLIPVTPALASITFYNQSGQYVWIAHAYEKYDTCSWQGECKGIWPNTKQVGWWNIFPGNWATVYGHDYRRLTRYYWLAEGGAGLVWYGSHSMCVPDQAHNRCSTGPSSCPAGERRLSYRIERSENMFCCICRSQDKEIILVP
jgi:uncharacterized membrane protein